MGITCNKKKKQNEAIIQNQIKLAVLEDENLSKYESYSLIDESQDEQFREQILQTEIEGLTNTNISMKQESQSDEKETFKKNVKKNNQKKRQKLQLNITILILSENH